MMDDDQLAKDERDLLVELEHLKREYLARILPIVKMLDQVRLLRKELHVIYADGRYQRHIEITKREEPNDG